jgi:thiol-disulfide isomerase/thioredoxin
MAVAPLAGACGASASAQGRQSPTIAVGQHGRSAAVQTLDGKPTDLARYVGHGAAVLEFWAKWCGNCRELEPALTAAHQQFGDRVTFVTVAVSVDQTPAEVAQYAREHGFPPDVVFDATGAAVDAYGVPGTSFIVVLDHSGTVVYVGGGGDQDVAKAIARAL